MSKTNQHFLSRRRFLKIASGSLPLVAMAACAPRTTPSPAQPPVQAPTDAGGAAPPSGSIELRMSWWGEQEAPGLENWLKESIALFEKETGHKIISTLQDTTVVVSEFQTASAANNAPDIQFLWNGIYHMESVWLGYLEPLNDWIPEEVLKAADATSLSIFENKQYRVGWYAVPYMWAYNKEMFDRAGLNADQPPKTWDEFLNACDKLKTSGVIPIVGGLKDGPWGEWFLGHSLTQNLDSASEAIELFVGTRDWRDPIHWEPWGRLEELWKAGYLNDDLNSIDLYPGIDLFGTGKGAITLIAGPLIPKMQSILGAEKVGVMVMPVFGKGKMAGKPMADTQGLGISSQSKHKRVAADFLIFLNRPERVNALWEQVKQLPANTNWDGSVITDPVIKQIWQEWMHGDNVPYVSNLMPTLFWTDAMFVNSQKIVAGEYTGEQAGQNAYEVTQKWIAQNPDLVEKYKQWANDLKL